jgi:prepilin-type processing-associated H-X9-DG protein
MRRIVTVAVILVVALLVAGLGVTFAYRVRSAANAMNCRNNLHLLIGIALQGYHDATGHFPSGTVPNSGLPPHKRLSWMTEICPTFVEGGYRTLLNNKKSWDDKENCPVRCRRRIDMQGNTREEPFGEAGFFFCPANLHMSSADLVSLTDYVGIAGLGEAAAELPLADTRAGFFGYDRQISINDIKDGAAETIAVTEVLDGGPWTAGGRATVRGLAASGLPYLGEGGQFAALHGIPKIFSWSQPVRTNVLFADGSVRPFTAAVSPQVFEALATIAGGEHVGELPDAY